MGRSPITCHVLDSSSGKPGAGVAVELHAISVPGAATGGLVAEGTTDSDGRVSSLAIPSSFLSEERMHPGVYKMVFQTGKYYTSVGVKGFYPTVEIVFNLEKPEEHYHIPLLLSPWSYTTYRGS